MNEINLIEVLFSKWIETEEAAECLSVADVEREKVEQLLYTLETEKINKLEIESMINNMCVEQCRASFEGGFNLARQLMKFLTNDK